MRNKLLIALLAVISFAAYIMPCESADVSISRGTPMVFNDTATTYTLTLNNLGDNEARISDAVNLGTGSTAEWYEVRATIQWNAAPDAGETCDIYYSTSDGNDPDGEGGGTDAAFTLVNLDNTKRIGSVVAVTAAADQDFTASFLVRITTQFFSIIVHNNAQATGDNLQATNDISSVTVTPITYTTD